MSNRILLSPPDTGPAEEEAALRALRSGWVAPLGPEVDAFESEIAEYTDRKYAVALSSGTAALHLALLTMGVRPGDYVVTATMTFAATANAITYTGAEPVFVDSDATGNLDPELLGEALADLKDEGKTVAAIVPVDLLGKIANYEAIGEVAAAHGVPILADSAESLGARRDGKPAGSFGDSAILSFNGNKIMTTSGGGMYLTNDAESANYVRYLATQARQPVRHYQHTDIGYNYRLSNILAAIGRAQLNRLDEMIQQRSNHRDQYRSLTRNISGATIFGETLAEPVKSRTRDNFWLTSIIIDPDTTGWPASSITTFLETHNIETRPLWKPMHLQPIFSNCRSYVNGTAEHLFENSVSLPSGSVFPDHVIERVCDLVGTYHEINTPQ